MHERPFSESSEQNKAPILSVLRQVFTAPGLVLEIGSGTGQHAVYFAAQLPHLVWQPTDVAAAVPGIEAWRASVALENLRPALALDVWDDPWPVEKADCAFSANTAHILSWPAVVRMFEGVARVLPPGGRFALYGPFNYGGAYTSESNARFDEWLKQRDPQSGIRDVGELKKIAAPLGLELWRDYEMPVNNRTLVWRKTT